MMKKFSWMMGVMTFLTVLLAALGAVCGAADQVAAGISDGAVRTAGAGKVCLTLSAVLAVLSAWVGAKMKSSVKSRLVGALAAVSVIMMIVSNAVNQVTAGGFDAEQTQMLANGANLALRMFLVVWVMLLIIYEIVVRMVRRHVK